MPPPKPPPVPGPIPGPVPGPTPEPVPVPPPPPGPGPCATVGAVICVVDPGSSTTDSNGRNAHHLRDGLGLGLGRLERLGLGRYNLGFSGRIRHLVTAASTAAARARLRDPHDIGRLDHLHHGRHHICAREHVENDRPGWPGASGPIRRRSARRPPKTSPCRPRSPQEAARWDWRPDRSRSFDGQKLIQTLWPTPGTSARVQ